MPLHFLACYVVFLVNALAFCVVHLARLHSIGLGNSNGHAVSVWGGITVLLLCCVAVLDDNRMLCLPNGERIKLDEARMRMLFEVEDLEYASPATISRCEQHSDLPPEILHKHECYDLLGCILEPLCFFLKLPCLMCRAKTTVFPNRCGIIECLLGK